MKWQRSGMLAIAGAVILAATVAAQAQSGQAQAPASRLRLSAPFRGEAQLAYTKPVVKQGKIDGRDFVITTFQVKNLEKSAIASSRARSSPSPSRRRGTRG